MFALKGFSENDFVVLRKFLTPCEKSKYGVIYQSEYPALQVYFLEQGSVKVVSCPAKDSGDDVVLGAVKAGGFFGEEALLRENQSYQNTVVAIENTVLLSMNREGLQRLMAESITVGTKLLLALSTPYREALAASGRMAQILIFYSPKGGVGCTTLAVNVAVLLAQAKKKVAFLDNDLQFGNANLFVGAPAALNVARLVQREERLTYDRIKLFFDHKFDLDFLYAPDLPQEAELVSRSNVSQILTALGPNYDFIVIDTQQEITDLTLMEWDLANALVIVTQPDFPGLSRLTRLLKVINRFNYPKEKSWLLLNRFRPEHSTILEDFRKLSIGNCLTIADDPQAAEAAALAGEPLVTRSKTGPLADGLQVFIDKVLGSNTAKLAQEGGIFSKIRAFFSN